MEEELKIEIEVRENEGKVGEEKGREGHALTEKNGEREKKMKRDRREKEDEEKDEKTTTN